MKKEGCKGEGKTFGSFNEVLLAFENKAIDINAKINVRHNSKWYKGTTVGRVIINSILPDEMEFVDDTIDKKRLSKLVNDTYLIAGNKKTVLFLDKLKNLGFNTATQAGLSIAISDIMIPESKDDIISKAQKQVDDIQNKFKRHVLTDGERYNKVIDVWTRATNDIAASMMDHLQSDDQGFNPVYMMADSGARGSQDQIKQLAGMRGLMAKPKKSMTGGKGEIIESPITSNFKEGLSVQEYFISTHGARKGLADTALKTADAGYLTRRLVDVAQDVVINEIDCGTINGILAVDLKEGEDIIEPLSERILGRTLLEDFIEKGKVLIKAGTMMRDEEALVVSDSNIESLRIRSVLTCESLRGVCAKCYGWNPSNHKLVDLGTSVGIQAAQSIGEPGTQLTMRTFHTGGIVDSVDITSGLPRIEELFEARSPKGQAVLSETDGIVTIKEADDGGRSISVVTSQKKTDTYLIKKGYQALVADGEIIEKDAVIAEFIETDENKSKSKTKKTKKSIAKSNILASAGGVVKVRKNKVLVLWYEEAVNEYVIPANYKIIVRNGQKVVVGDSLTFGPKSPQQILSIQGQFAVQQYLVDEVQMVYRSQGVKIHDKHIELIVSRMLKKVSIDEAGDLETLPGELMDQVKFNEMNAQVIMEGKQPATATPVLLGITRASLNTDSFLAAASFQETTRVLTEASVNGEVDHLRGLKENVIIGRLIPTRNDFVDKFVSFIEIPFPYAFNDEFFKWFEYKEWDRLKGIFKEMKRRRGDGKAIKIDLSFSGQPKTRFLVESDEGQWFRKAVEKIDFVVELLPYHLDPEKLPPKTTEIVYEFDKDSVRWKINHAIANKEKFVNSENGWKVII